MEKKTRANCEMIYQTLQYKHPSDFKKELPGSAVTRFISFESPHTVFLYDDGLLQTFQAHSLSAFTSK